jgi:hypothetical protein
VRRPIGPRLPQRDAHLAVVGQGEPLGRDGRSQDIAADPLEPIALPRRNDEPRMQVQPVPARMTRARWALDRGARVSEASDASARVRPEGDEPLHRRGRQARERRRLVRPGIHIAILGVAPRITLGAFSAPEQPPDPGLHGRQDLRHVQRRQTPRRMKPDRAGGIARQDAIEHEGVDVDVQIQRPPEPLNDGHGTGTRLLGAGSAGMVFQQAEHRAQKHGSHTPTQVVVPCEPVAHPVREAQHPLPDGDVRDDAIDQMRGAFGHAAATAARTQRPALARERHELVVAAFTAATPREPARQAPAPEEVPKRPLDKVRHTLAVAYPGGLRQEGLEVILHDPVEHAAGGTTRFVARGEPGHPPRVAAAMPTSQSPANRPKPIRRVGGVRADRAW